MRLRTQKALGVPAFLPPSRIPNFLQFQRSGPWTGAAAGVAAAGTRRLFPHDDDAAQAQLDDIAGYQLWREGPAYLPEAGGGVCEVASGDADAWAVSA